MAEDGPLEISRLVADFVSAIPSLGLSYESGLTADKEWTRRVFAYFRENGEREGCVVYPDRKRGHGGREYLVDLCWVKKTKDAHWIEMALECEWDRNSYEILYDFTKLTRIHALKKVFICRPGTRVARSLPDKVQGIISAHALRNPDEAYGLIMFPVGVRVDRQARIHIETRTYDGEGRLLDSKSCSISDDTKRSGMPPGSKEG